MHIEAMSFRPRSGRSLSKAIGPSDVFDVIVAGSGAAGLTAAASAAAAGASVLVVEASERFGGTSALSGGGVWVPGNHAMIEAGLEDGSEAGLAYLRHLAGHLAAGAVDDDMLRVYVEQAPRMLRFVEAHSPIRFRSAVAYPDYYPEAPGGRSGGRTVEAAFFDGERLGAERARLRDPIAVMLILGQVMASMREARTLAAGGLRGTLLAVVKLLGYALALPWRRRRGRDRRLALGNALVAGLRVGLDRQGVAVAYGTRLVGIERADGGPVQVAGGPVQVRLRDGDGERVVTARGGVVVATGGFSRSAAHKQRLQSASPEPAWSAAVDEDDGTAIDLADAIGAQTALTGESWWMPVTCVPGDARPHLLVIERSLPGSLIVDVAGDRFANESAPYEDFVKAMWSHVRARQQPPRAWMIIDAANRRRYPTGPMLPGGVYPERRWSAAHRAWMRAADSVGELAKLIAMAPDRLEATLHRFNAMAARGVDDDFRRGESLYDRYYGDPACVPNPCLRALSGRLYAFEIHPGELGSKGGMVVDVEGRVVDGSGVAIDGIYAAGNATANPLGDLYPGAGGTLGPGMTWGFLAGRHAAGRAKG